MLTVVDPTAVTITVSRGTLLADWLGYRLRVTGFSMTPVGLASEFEFDEPPPQAASITAGTMAAETTRVCMKEEPSLIYSAPILTGSLSGWYRITRTLAAELSHFPCHCDKRRVATRRYEGASPV